MKELFVRSAIASTFYTPSEDAYDRATDEDILANPVVVAAVKAARCAVGQEIRHIADLTTGPGGPLTVLAATGIPPSTNTLIAAILRALAGEYEQGRLVLDTPST